MIWSRFCVPCMSTTWLSLSRTTVVPMNVAYMIAVVCTVKIGTYSWMVDTVVRNVSIASYISGSLIAIVVAMPLCIIVMNGISSLSPSSKLATSIAIF